MDEFQVTVVERLTRIETKIDNGITSKIKDHESRVRFLEKGFWLGMGGLAVLQVLLTILSKTLFK